MHNLLPEENKKNIKKEYWLRLITVSLSLFSFLGIIFFLLLLPSLIVSRSREGIVLKDKQAVDQSVGGLESENLNALLKETKEKVDNLKAGNTSLPLYVIIEKILSQKNSNIKITGFVFTPEKEKIREVTLEGVASSRESLVQFRNDLEKEKIFTVSLPVSNFAKSTEINFVVDLRVDLK